MTLMVDMRRSLKQVRKKQVREACEALPPAKNPMQAPPDLLADPRVGRRPFAEYPGISGSQKWAVSARHLYLRMNPAFPKARRFS